ncbi:MAG: hypothetical protein MH321_14270 [Leptospiraceae bacterium]|nr:hypothetical protein [Leptospiraceae bacterium]
MVRPTISRWELDIRAQNPYAPHPWGAARDGSGSLECCYIIILFIVEQRKNHPSRIIFHFLQLHQQETHAFVS